MIEAIIPIVTVAMSVGVAGMVAIDFTRQAHKRRDRGVALAASGAGHPPNQRASDTPETAETRPAPGVVPDKREVLETVRWAAKLSVSEDRKMAALGYEWLMVLKYDVKTGEMARKLIDATTDTMIEGLVEAVDHAPDAKVVVVPDSPVHPEVDLIVSDDEPAPESAQKESLTS